MPVQEYICPDKHVSVRRFTFIQQPKVWVKCQCGKRAKKREVYRVGVGGDLPTRSAF